VPTIAPCPLGCPADRATICPPLVLRIVQFTSPSDLTPLPPPPHWVPLTFSTSNYAPPVPTSLTARAPTTPPLPAPYGRNGNNNRRRPAQALPKPVSRVPSDAGQDEGTVIGDGPGGIALREIATLRGLREATGGSGVVEARWGWGGTCFPPLSVRFDKRLN
jgi:hypothetical protein